MDIKTKTKYNPFTGALQYISDASHTVSLTRTVFKQTFTGNGSQTEFQLTGTENASFVDGSVWANSKILNTLSADITKINNAIIYDSTNIFTRNTITVSNINASGLVTLDYPPMDGNQFIIWYWYELAVDDSLENYYREDYVNEIEGKKPALLASDIPIADDGNIITGTEVETALQENRTAIDLNTVHSQITSGNPHQVTMSDLTALRTETSDYLVVLSDYTIFADATSNTVTITLPASPNQGQVFNIKCINNTFTCTVARNGNNIDGSASDKVLVLNESLTFQYDSSFGWGII